MPAERHCPATRNASWPVLCLLCLECQRHACREALRGDKSTSPVAVTFLTRWVCLEREDEGPATAVGYPAVDYAPPPIWMRPSPVS